MVAAAPVAADAVHDETSAEDPEACYAGAPFVQPEHEIDIDLETHRNQDQ